MFRHTIRNGLFATLALPMLMGQGCPPPTEIAALEDNDAGQVLPGQPTQIVNATTASLSFGVFGFTDLAFTPTAAGKVVTITISGNATGSRPAVLVSDPNFNTVAFEPFPTTSTTTVQFVSTTTGPHRIFAQEAGQPSSLYTITAVQQP